MSDYYSDLGVERGASADEIKAAYRKLAMQHHPDRGGDQAQFQKIQEAYATLSDDQKRAHYDNPMNQQFGGMPFEHHFGQQFNFNDIFNMFGTRFHQPSYARMTLWINLVDVAKGGSRTVGIGTQTGTVTVEIDLPAGLEDGDNVQYRGLAPGGQDLVVTFRIHPDPRWQRNGADLTTDLSATFWQLVAGDTMHMQDIEGNKLEIVVPPRTQPGTLLRVRGRGLVGKNGQRGDMLVRMGGRIPPVVSPELLAAINLELGR